jgi:tetratricopeptide (TPR) repeat protein
MKTIASLLQPFYGYLELKMYVEANDELEGLPTKLKVHPVVLLCRLELLVEMKRWEDGVTLGQSLCGLWPDEMEFWFRSAYCLHELKRTLEAKDTLLKAPMAIRDTAVFSYNLACYETQLGNLKEAKRLLKECFERDEGFRVDALEDPDLEPLWSSPGKP